MKFVHVISQRCSIFKSFEAQVTIHCCILFILVYSIKMKFQVVVIWENFLANLTGSFIKQAYKENIKEDSERDSLFLFSTIDIYGIYCCAFSEPVGFYTFYCTIHTQKSSRRSDECHESALRARHASKTAFHKKDKCSALLENNDKCSEGVESVHRGVGLVPVVHWHVPPETIETGRGLVTNLTDKQLSLVLMDVSYVNS